MFRQPWWIDFTYIASPMFLGDTISQMFTYKINKCVAFSVFDGQEMEGIKKWGEVG